jgi:uncharacterized iron-regulated membrane protein
MISRKPGRFRLLHRSIAPIMVLPLLLTAITGSIYQISELTGNEMKWLLAVHKGNFGALKLEAIYPFLNALGLLTMLATGTVMLVQARRNRRREPEENRS